MALAGGQDEGDGSPVPLAAHMELAAEAMIGSSRSSVSAAAAVRRRPRGRAAERLALLLLWRRRRDDGRGCWCHRSYGRSSRAGPRRRPPAGARPGSVATARSWSSGRSASPPSATARSAPHRSRHGTPVLLSHSMALIMVRWSRAGCPVRGRCGGQQRRQAPPRRIRQLVSAHVAGQYTELTHFENRP